MLGRVALLSVILLAGAAGGCHRSPAQPRLVLQQARWDLGTIVQDGSTRLSIPLANNGSVPLAVTAIVASRFCSADALPAPIGAGAASRFEVTCRPDLDGPMKEQLRIESNDPAGARTIELTATVQPLLGFDTAMFDESLLSGETRSRVVRLTGALEDEARLELPEIHESVMLVESVPGGVRLQCTGKRPGHWAGTLMFATGLQRPAQISLPWACKVAGTLTVSPTNPYFNLKIPGPKQVTIDVTSTQPGFEVKSARIAHGPFTARLERAGAGAFRVNVSVVERRVPAASRAVSGGLLILSNDRTEPRKQLDLLGLGHIAKDASRAGRPGL